MTAPAGQDPGALGTPCEIANPPGEGAGADEPAGAAGRRERYRLQAVAARILPDGHRTASCMKTRVHSAVTLWRGAGGGVHYGGLATCGSVWTCPVCAARVSQQRREEVQGAMDQHRAQGGEVLLVTFTAPHTRDDDLAPWLAAFSDALQRTKRGNPWARIRDRIRLVGSIRAMECTWGEANGWHPHVHELWFTEPGVDRESLEAQLFERWRTMAAKAGLPEPTPAHGVTVQGGGQADAYLTKWGLEPSRATWTAADEVAAGQAKVAAGGRYTPWDFLRACAAAPKGHHPRMAGLFRRYAEAFRGRQQLVWSKGLKDRFGVEDQADEDVAAAAEEPPAEVLAVLYPVHWRKVMAEGAREDLLDLAEGRGFEGVRRWFELRGMVLPDPVAATKDDQPDPCARGGPLDLWGEPVRDRGFVPRETNKEANHGAG